LALILFYLELVVEEFAWKECFSWRATYVDFECMYLVSFSIFGASSRRAHMWKLASYYLGKWLLEDDYFIVFAYLHL
jgi:hypothetical protein